MTETITSLHPILPSITHGHHCCLLFTSVENQIQITAPFLALGLERDERSIYVGSDDSVEGLRQQLKHVGVNVDQESKKNRLILSSDQDYLDQGRFNIDKMITFLQQAYDGAMADGFTALRAAGDVSWQVGPENDFKDIVYYETLLDVFFLGKKMVGMCQYPKDRCPPDVLSGILNTHKVAAIDGEICENFHYMPPDLLMETDPNVRREKRMEWMTSQLLRTRRAEEELKRTYERFLHAQKMEAVGRLAGGVAHDFNNALSVILGSTDILLEELQTDDPHRGDVEDVRRAAQHASTLTKQLLTFSRRQPYNLRPLQLNDVIKSNASMLRRLIGENIEIALKLSRDLHSIKGDPGQLEQVFINLVVNSRDAMPKGGKLTIETANVELDGEYVRSHSELVSGDHVMLALTDTGLGMDEDTKRRIFEPFFTTKPQGRGTGLGLSTVFGIVKQLGGNIWVYSEVGHGTTFKIYFPRLEGVAHDLNSKEAGPRPKAPAGKTILVVEDDDMVRKVLTRMLKRAGFHVIEAANGEEAISACDEKGTSIDLMMTDLMMPKMGGRELVDRLKKSHPALRVIFMSGYTEGAIAHQGILDPNLHFLEKPFESKQLIEKVQKVLNSD